MCIRDRNNINDENREVEEGKRSKSCKCRCKFNKKETTHLKTVLSCEERIEFFKDRAVIRKESSIQLNERLYSIKREIINQ